MLRRFSVWFLALALCGASAKAEVVLVEAESFKEYGGWVLDQQFMDQMGSSYLLAHGLGEPVKDATTVVEFPAPGTYRLWVRTKDWVAQWKAPGTPGKFQVLVNDKAVPTVFGTEGAAWHWQDGGSVEIPAKRVTLALHDLTGFEGRCDAILFSSDANYTPPADRAALSPKQPVVDGGEFDLVVVGGGISGMCAALKAARLGVSVALVQDRPVLGGNNSSEVRVWLGGEVQLKPYPHVGDIVKEFEPKKRAHSGPENTAEIYEDAKREALLSAEKNLKLFFNQRVNEVEAKGGAISAVIGEDIRTGKRIRLKGRWFADCTGDGAVGALAGADFEVTNKQHMGPSNLWNSKDTGAPVSFPRCPWAVDLSDKPFPGRTKPSPTTNVAPKATVAKAKSTATAKPPVSPLSRLGQWYWESGFDRDPVTDVESMRDLNFRAMYGAWDALKNVDKLYPNHKLNWSAYVAGKRESRRLLGDVVLTGDDLREAKKFPDAAFPCTWSMDLHVPDKSYRKGFEGDEFISTANFGKYPRPGWVPYRCLYSRNVSNLFMAGRDISVTHEALGAVRVMRTCGAGGEVVGMAASLCKKFNTTPRGVYEKHLKELIALLDQPTPPRP